VENRSKDRTRTGLGSSHSQHHPQRRSRARRAALLGVPLVAVACGAVSACSSQPTGTDTGNPAGTEPPVSRPSTGGAGGGASAARIDPARIDENVRVRLVGNTHPLATPEHDVGRMEPHARLEHLQLVLKRSATDEARVVAHVDALHDKTSPLYQNWLTAAAFGDEYGVSRQDIETITRWLASYGMQVDRVPPSRMFLEFTGTAAQVSRAFHTDVHYFDVDGARHFANVRDPEIPAALEDVVAGVHALHDFMPHPMHKDVGAIRRDRTGAARVVTPSPDFSFPFGQCASNADCASGTCNTATQLCTCTNSTQCSATLSGAAASCNTTTSTCVQCQSNADCIGPATCNTTNHTCAQTLNAVSPADFATIYNLNPLFAGGIAGFGQTVVVIEDTLLMSTSDVAAFRSAFGLSGYKGTFTQITATGVAATCTNSGVNSAEGEAALDAEWAGASAPDAAIVLASCKDTATVFGGLIALENLINGASPPPIVSISYGECEAQNGAAANASYVTTYQQAAAEGVSVFVSSGDEGAASCDPNRTVATHGIAVSGFASTPYNVAVGGTDFKDYYDSQKGGPALTTYWNASNTSVFGSALSYIPEVPWNDSCASQLIYSTPAIALGTYTSGSGATGFCNSTIGKTYFRTTGSGSGGPSNYSAQPTWQTGVVGLPTKSGGARYLPDVSLFAANGVFGHFLVYCLTDAAEGGVPCVYTSAADTLSLAAGGTSFASPALAGIQALINQKMGGSQGNPNYTYYKLAGAEQGARGSTRCASGGANSVSPNLPRPECVFNDVTQGDIDVNCTGATNCFGYSKVGAVTTQGALSVSSTAFTSAYAAGTGWDFATGLGTVNAYNLVNAWSQ
jgi:subtilase family serine protease